MATPKDIRYLNPPTAEAKKKKYCRFKKAGIRYIDYKDPEFLLKAFAALSGRVSGPAPHLVLAGKGPLGEPLEALASTLGIRDRTHFLGPQTAPQIAAWMRRASLLVMTSRNEGLPNVILESQACGLPAVATDVGGIHEVIDAPWKGRLTPLDDMPAWIEAVLEMLSNLPSRASLAEVGMARTWPATALAYEQVLVSAMGGADSVKP